MQAKQSLTVAPVLAYFDASRETHLYTDASTLGLGFLLLQKQTENSSDWRVDHDSSLTQSRYAVIELECLAVTWAIKKCHLFSLLVSATSLWSLTTTHSQLASFRRNREPLAAATADPHHGLQFYCPVAQGCAADALSRHPYQQPVDGDDLAEHEIDTMPFVKHSPLHKSAHQHYHHLNRKICTARSSGNMPSKTRNTRPSSPLSPRDFPIKSPPCLTHRRDFGASMTS